MTTTATTTTPRRVAGTVQALVGILFIRLRLSSPFDAWALRHWVPWWKVREDGIPLPRKHVHDDDANRHDDRSAASADTVRREVGT